jgi:hypothetical protein
MKKKLKALERYYYFFFHTKKVQIFRRFVSRFLRPLSYIYIRNSKYRVDNVKINYFEIKLNKSVNQTTDILNNQFTFLNNKFSFKNNVEWANNEQNSLWNFHLNYFDYLNDLIILYKTMQQEIFLLKGQSLVQEWTNCSNRYNNVMWAPYTISLRLLNWMSFYSYLIEYKHVDSVPKTVLVSIRKQLRYLKMNLEHDVRGNHLFENLKTIILTEYFLDNTRLVNKYIKRINRALKKQVLEDGCHFEKSISYHIIVLNGILDVLSIVDYNLDSLNTLKKYASIMLEFYNKIKYTNVDYPLFNDSNYTMTEKITGDVFKKKSSLVLSENHLLVKRLKFTSKYFVYQNQRLRLTMDLGNLGSNYLLAHSHNDIFNFEVLVDNQKIITDTGVFEYENSKQRHHSRSTQAHNTVQVNGYEQSDIWSSFRNGYRPTRFTTNIEERKNYKLFKGKYKYKNKYTHERNFYITTNNAIVIIDNVISKKKYSLNSYLHFAPEVKVILHEDIIEVLCSTLKLYLYAFNKENCFDNKNITLFDSNYYPYFGTELTRKSLVINLETRKIGYVITLDKIIDINYDGIKLTLKYEDGKYEDLETL